MRKSLHRARNRANAKKRANQRAAKARKRIERGARPYDYAPELADAARCQPAEKRSLHFRITVECLSDKSRASFTTAEIPDGFTVSPTLCGQRVAKVIQFYRPQKHTCNTAR
jgi:hypothetical protein